MYRMLAAFQAAGPSVRVRFRVSHLQNLGVRLRLTQKQRQVHSLGFPIPLQYFQAVSQSLNQLLNTIDRGNWEGIGR